MFTMLCPVFHVSYVKSEKQAHQINIVKSKVHRSPLNQRYLVNVIKFKVYYVDLLLDHLVSIQSMNPKGTCANMNLK